jgi:hypothetical protein
VTSAMPATPRDDAASAVVLGIYKVLQGHTKHTSCEEHHTQAGAPVLDQEEVLLRDTEQAGKLRLTDAESDAPRTQHLPCPLAHDSLALARHADNVAVMAKNRKPSKRGAGAPARRDNDPAEMDYVQSRKRAAPISPVVNRGGNTGQVKDRSSGARNSGVSRDADDPTDKQLVAVRREIHNRLGRLQKLQATVTQLLTSLAELEVRERSLVFDLWAAAPSRLAEINDSTRRWRRRKGDL